MATMYTDSTDHSDGMIAQLEQSTDGMSAVIDTAIAAAEPLEVRDAAGEVIASQVILPRGYRTALIDHEAFRRMYADRPQRKTGDYNVQDTASFLDYFGKHQTPDAEIWQNGDTYRAVLNAHGANQAAFEDHILTLKLVKSPELRAWMAIDGKTLDQASFAEFVEDHVTDVVAPSAADLMEVALTMQELRKVEFRSNVRLQNGARSLTFNDQSTASAGQNGELDVPERIVISVAYYADDEAKQPFSLKFRYRVENGNLRIGVKFEQLDRARQNAQTRKAAQLFEATGVPVLVQSL